MNLLKIGKRLVEALVFLSVISLTASPVTTLIGIELPHQVDNALSLVQYTLLSGLIVLSVTLILIVGLGYLTVTGWLDHKTLPLPLRICFSLVLGIIVLTLSHSLSFLIPIPLLPTAIATLALWVGLRVLSTYLIPATPTPSITITDAIDRATAFIHQQDPDTPLLDVLETKRVGNHWTLHLFSPTSTKHYTLQVDSLSGEIKTWTID